MLNKTLNADFIKDPLSPLNFNRYEQPSALIKKCGWDDGGLAGGDFVAFAMVLYRLKFVEALAKLADEWGLL